MSSAVPSPSVMVVPLTDKVSVTCRSVKASNTAAPEPAPSSCTIATLPLAIVTFAPEPCEIIMLYGPELPESVVAFSIIWTRFIVFGPIVIVQSESKAPVYLRYMALPASAEPSATVVV